MRLSHIERAKYWPTLFIGIFGLCSILLPPKGFSAEPETDNQAYQVLRQATGHLTKSKSFHLTAEAMYDVVQDSGQTLQFSDVEEVWIRRPNKARVTIQRDDGRKRRVWYDGKKVSIFEERENVYSSLKVPDTIDAALDYMERDIYTPIPLADLFYSDLSFLETRAETGFYVGKSSVRGVSCHHLAFQNALLDWQLWIDAGETPVFRKLALSYKNRDGNLQYTVWLTDWEFDLELSDDVFNFTPPQGAEQIQILAIPPALRGQRTAQGAAHGAAQQ